MARFNLPIRPTADQPPDLPDRLFGKVPVQPQLQKYIPSRFPQIKSITRAVSSQARGARDRHERGAGCGGRERAADERHRSGRRSRVVLTPRRWRQVGGKHPADDGDNKARSPGRSRGKPLKPLRAGMPGESGEPVVTMLVCFLFFACEAAGASSTRHSPRPHFLEGRNDRCITRAHCVAGMRRCVCS